MGRKGSAEVTSCLWSFLQMKSEKGIEEFRIYSDNCSAQNKNQFLFSLYVLASIRFNIKIVHRYLEVGHTHMEVDSVHAAIENAVKNLEIFVPSDWYTAMRLAKKNRPLYVVKEMSQDIIFDFTPLASHQKWDKLRTSRFREVVFDGAEPGIICYKTDFEGRFKKVSIFKETVGRLMNWHTIKLKRMYAARIPVKPKTLKGLKDLCSEPTPAIPTIHHEYYTVTLPAITDFVPPEPPEFSDIDSDGESIQAQSEDESGVDIDDPDDERDTSGED